MHRLVALPALVVLLALTNATAAVCGGGWIGVTPDPQFAGSGVRIAALDPQGPAAAAGLRTGDVLIAADDTPLHRIEDLARWTAQALPGDHVQLRLQRDGNARELTLQLWGVPASVCAARLAPAAGTPAAEPRAPPVAAAGRSDGRMARVAVGAFELKAAQASAAISDGLREMLVSALQETGQVIVVERGGASDAGSPDRADVLVLGALTEFEPEAGGSHFMTPVMGARIGIGTTIRWSELAIDLRVVDLRTSRVLAAQRIPGMARSAQGTIAGALPIGPLAVPGALNVYRNTPMEAAIRDCLRKAAYFVVYGLDEDYFRPR
ncbi:CsgG/HfaB family protein [Aquabacterium sp.]|uniref:CsgG/HfaB family protein n=1 Tax=Aquabacterium sp. TaxID=1872578 RepID=UPI00378400A7